MNETVSCCYDHVIQYYGVPLTLICPVYQVNAISCSTCWKISLFMEFKEDRDDILKGVSVFYRIRVCPCICVLCDLPICCIGRHREVVSCGAGEVSHL